MAKRLPIKILIKRQIMIYVLQYQMQIYLIEYQQKRKLYGQIRYSLLKNF